MTVEAEAAINNDKLVEDYLRGSKLQRKAIEDLINADRIPRRHLLLLAYPTMAVALWFGIHISIFNLIREGALSVTPYLGTLDALATVIIWREWWTAWLTYRRKKATIHTLISDYRARHPDSPLLKELFNLH